MLRLLCHGVILQLGCCLDAFELDDSFRCAAAIQKPPRPATLVWWLRTGLPMPSGLGEDAAKDALRLFSADRRRSEGTVPFDM